MGNLLRSLAIKYDANKIGKRHDYCYLDVYYDLFRPLKDDPLDILEIGICHGGSLKMWEDFFPNARIVGVDRKLRCHDYRTDRVQQYEGDQGDVDFLKSIPGEYDIIIDDGSHHLKHQQHTLEIFFPKVKPAGYYIIEDLQTSYIEEKYGGALGAPHTTIEKLKPLIDQINWAWWKEKPETYMEQNLYMMLFFDSLCVMRKKWN